MPTAAPSILVSALPDDVAAGIGRLHALFAEAVDLAARDHDTGRVHRLTREYEREVARLVHPAARPAA